MIAPDPPYNAELTPFSPGDLFCKNNHSETIENDAVINNLDPRPFGNDVIAGVSEDDEIFAQLGDDIVQGDGLIEITEDDANYDPYNPSQSADPSFDLHPMVFYLTILVQLRNWYRNLNFDQFSEIQLCKQKLSC